MIEEAYVSLEVAKLLKAKGFNEATNRYYNAQYNECRTVADTFMWHWNDEEFMKHVMMEGAIAIPTHQMIMTWLREVHHLFININIEVGDIQMLPSYDFEESVLGYSFAIYNEETLVWMFKDKTPRSYEEAVEAAIKYSLENLI